jgi:hypothetical protein
VRRSICCFASPWILRMGWTTFTTRYEFRRFPALHEHTAWTTTHDEIGRHDFNDRHATRLALSPIIKIMNGLYAHSLSKIRCQISQLMLTRLHCRFTHD